MLRRALPLSAGLIRVRAGVLVVLLVAIAVEPVAVLVGAALGSSAPQDGLLGTGLWVLFYACVGTLLALRAAWVTQRRGAWAAMSAGMWIYAVGTAVSAATGDTLSHSLPAIAANGLWLAAYPFWYGAVKRLGGLRGGGRTSAGSWLDWLILSAALCAVASSLALSALVRDGADSTLGLFAKTSFPIADILIFSLIAGGRALRGARRDRAWTQLGVTFLAMAVADCLYVVTVTGNHPFLNVLDDVLYAVAGGALALSAWQSIPAPVRTPAANRSLPVLPVTFLFVAIALLQFDYAHHLGVVSFLIAELTLVLSIARLALWAADLRSVERERRQALVDELTGLPNRRALVDLIRTRLGDAERRSATAALVVNLDNFKELNDTLGHSAGDELLRLAAARIAEAIGQRGVVGRLGGDAFVAVLEAGDHGLAGGIAEQVCAALRQPFPLADLRLRATGSAGLALFPTDGADEQELIAHAEVAMFEAKRRHVPCVFYDRQLDGHSVEQLSLMHDFAQALDAGELTVHYQPKVAAGSRAIVGVEALVRWPRATGQPVPPDQFVAAAERAGLSRRLTRFVLESALADLAGWRAAGRPALHVAVNTTVSDLLDLDFPAEVSAGLARHGLGPDALVLEVTESAVLSDPARIETVLGDLRARGITVALDDFGTGYSSLSHLIRLPVSELKLDRSFVGAISDQAQHAAVVESMVALGHRLGLKIVAEGVEDEATWRRLAILGADLIQGYVVSRPVPAQSLTLLLDEDSARELSTPRPAVAL